MIVIIKYILDVVFNIMLILACLAMSYAALSALISTICSDISKRRDVTRLIKENIDLKEKINQLEIELVDKELAKEYNNNKRTKNWVLVCFSFPREKSLGFFRLFYEKCLTYWYDYAIIIIEER